MTTSAPTSSQQPTLFEQHLRTTERRVMVAGIKPLYTTNSEILRSIGIVGVMVPLLLKPSTDPNYQYEIVAGRRRVHSAIHFEIAEVPAVITTGKETKPQLAMLRTLENMARSSNPVAEARGLREVLDSGMYANERDLAQEMDLSVQTIRQRLQLMKLPEEVLRGIETGKVSEKTAQRVAKLDRNYQGEAIRSIRTALALDEAFTANDLRSILTRRQGDMNSKLSGLLGTVPDLQSSPLLSLTAAQLLAEEFRSIAQERNVALDDVMAQLGYLPHQSAQNQESADLSVELVAPNTAVSSPQLPSILPAASPQSPAPPKQVRGRRVPQDNGETKLALPFAPQTTAPLALPFPVLAADAVSVQAAALDAVPAPAAVLGLPFASVSAAADLRPGAAPVLPDTLSCQATAQESVLQPASETQMAPTTIALPFKTASAAVQTQAQADVTAPGDAPVNTDSLLFSGLVAASALELGFTRPEADGEELQEMPWLTREDDAPTEAGVPTQASGPRMDDLEDESHGDAQAVTVTGPVNGPATIQGRAADPAPVAVAVPETQTPAAVPVITNALGLDMGETATTLDDIPWPDGASDFSVSMNAEQDTLEAAMRDQDIPADDQFEVLALDSVDQAPTTIPVATPAAPERLNLTSNLAPAPRINLNAAPTNLSPRLNLNARK